MTIKTKRKENEDPNAKFLSLQLLCLLTHTHTHTHTHGSLYFIHGPPKIMISQCQRLPYYNFVGAMNELQVCVSRSLCVRLCDPMDSRPVPPGSSVHGILQARILEWVAIPFSRGSTWPKDQTQVSGIAGRYFTI